MKILILSQFFDPEPVLKGMVFAQELRRRGCDVTVLTGFPNYPGGRLYEGYRIRPWHREVIEGVNVVRVPIYPSHDRSAIRRIANYLSFAVSASILGPMLIERPDVIYVYHPPLTVAIPAVVIRWWSGAPFVFEIQDLWPDTLKATGMLPRPGFLRLIGAACQSIYRSADHLVVISDGFRRALIGRGVPAEKVEVIPNWCDERRLQRVPRDGSLATRLGVDGAFVVMFAGTMGLAQGLDTVIAAAEQCSVSMPDVRFVLVGGGLERERLVDSVAERGLRNVTFVPQQRMEEMSGILALADVLLVHLRDDPLFAITIPSKTQAYLYVGAPIIMAVRGDAAELVLQSGAGTVCEPENATALVEAVAGLRALSPEARAAMAQRGHDFYMRRLSLATGTARYVHLLRELTSAR